MATLLIASKAPTLLAILRPCYSQYRPSFRSDVSTVSSLEVGVRGATKDNAYRIGFWDTQGDR